MSPSSTHSARLNMALCGFLSCGCSRFLGECLCSAATTGRAGFCSFGSHTTSSSAPFTPCLSWSCMVCCSRSLHMFSFARRHRRIFGVPAHKRHREKVHAPDFLYESTLHLLALLMRFFSATSSSRRDEMFIERKLQKILFAPEERNVADLAY